MNTVTTPNNQTYNDQYRAISKAGTLFLLIEFIKLNWDLLNLINSTFDLQIKIYRSMAIAVSVKIEPKKLISFTLSVNLQGTRPNRQWPDRSWNLVTVYLRTF